MTKQFIRGTGLGGGIGSILYKDEPSADREYFLYNVIGSTVATTNPDASVKSTSLYEAFGKVVASTGTSDNNRLFCTKERSASIGLDNFGFRYFDWEIGRFIQRDPAGYPDGLNNYLYCSNNPINRIDPLGLKSRDEYQDDIKKVKEKKEFHHTEWKEKNKYDDASDKEKSKLDKKWDKEAASYDKAIDEIKGYIDKYDKKRNEYNEKAKKVFGGKEIDQNWDDEKVLSWEYGKKEKTPVERIDRELAKILFYILPGGEGVAGATLLAKQARTIKNVGQGADELLVFNCKSNK